MFNFCDKSGDCACVCLREAYFCYRSGMRERESRLLVTFYRSENMGKEPREFVARENEFAPKEKSERE